MPNVLSANAANASTSPGPLSTSTPKFGSDVFYDLQMKEPFARPIPKQDAKLLFGDLSKYEGPEWNKIEVLCQPGAKVEFGTACAVHLGGSCFLIGVVETRRPDRSKTYRVRFLNNGRLSARTIDCEKESVSPIVTIGGYRSL